MRFQALEVLGQKKGIEKGRQYKPTVHTVVKTSQNKCQFCEKRHAIYYCKHFLKLSTQGRQAAAKRLNLCLNCLKKGHKSSNCTLKECIKCKQKHNTLIHVAVQKPSSPQSVEASVHFESFENINEQENKNISSYIFLSTAKAIILDHYEKEIECRLLLDSGSQINFISERLRKKLKMESDEEEMDISGIGQAKLKSNDRINITLKSKAKSKSTLKHM